MNSTRRSLLATFSLIPLLALAPCGCKEEARVVQYRAPKEPAKSAPDMGQMRATPALAAQTAAFSAPEWTAPASWSPLAASPMRKGGWKTGAGEGAAEVSVTAFPGDVGGLRANVDRWRGQVGLPVTESEAKLAEQVSPFRVSGTEGRKVSLANGGKALVAILASHGGATWFFKITGSERAVADSSADFEAFVSSVKFPGSPQP